MELISINKCFSCLACKNICPQKAISTVTINGFNYPVINQDLCVNCKKCKLVCPAENIEKNKKFIPQLYAFQHNDKETLLQSSSGGAFTALSDLLFSNNYVIFGAVFDNENKIVHLIADNILDRNKMRGSKYVQSDMYEAFNYIRKNANIQKKIFFSGTPCQVDAFKRFCILNKLDMKNIFLCSLVCHGASSPTIWKDYLDSVIKEKNIKECKINFRDKKDGWKKGKMILHSSGFNYSLDDYSTLYHSNLLNRESCFTCPYTNVYRNCDVSLGDFWTISKFDKEYKIDFSEQYGISMIISHSEKGDKLIKQCKKYGKLKKYPFSPDKTILPLALTMPYKKPIEYESFWKDYNNNGISKIIKKYTSRSIPYKILRFIRKMILQLKQKRK